MKIAIIGGGSTYTPELVEGFCKLQDVLPLTQLWLMDIDVERLQIVGSFAQRMASFRHANFEVILSNDLHEFYKRCPVCDYSDSGWRYASKT